MVASSYVHLARKYAAISGLEYGNGGCHLPNHTLSGAVQQKTRARRPAYEVDVLCILSRALGGAGGAGVYIVTS